MINSKIRVFAQADFALGALQFGSVLFVLRCSHDISNSIPHSDSSIY
jgi:hypothetical protein